MEAEKARAELNILKAQINPHFLFNTLNNIYALAVTGNEHTAPSIMKLSQIMRYITETAQQDEVPLESAVTCITDYIDLHRLRLNRKAQVDYTVSGELKGLYISPLILLPFVENIFKYGISSHEPSPVTIRLEAREKQVHFFCQNRIFPQQRISESTGIGIDNTSKRLALLYPNKHQLHISTGDGLFTVSLDVQL
jgi:LytS/YehU family sensor histidine kinase